MMVFGLINNKSCFSHLNIKESLQPMHCCLDILHDLTYAFRSRSLFQVNNRYKEIKHKVINICSIRL